MKTKSVFVLLVIILSGPVCFAGELDVWVSSINGEQIGPVKDLVAFRGDVLGIDVIYTNEPGYYLFALSSVLYIKGCGFFDISEAEWNPGIDPNPVLTGIEKVESGIKMWAVAMDVDSVPSEGEPVVVLENIKFTITGDNSIIYLLEYKNTTSGLTIELDDEFNMYEVNYGYGIFHYTAGWGTWPADLNCNFEINFEDFAIFAQSLNSSFGDDEYNPNCELGSNNGHIDIRDFKAFIDYWLEPPIEENIF